MVRLIGRSDSPSQRSYRAAMAEEPAFIRLTLNIDQPIELTEFLGAFTSIAAEYDRFVRMRDTDTRPDATVFVKEVRSGSIIADLLPYWPAAAVPVAAVGILEAANIVHEFVERYGSRLRTYLKPGARLTDATKAELKDFSEQVAAVATHPGSTLEIAAIEIKSKKEEIRAVFKFTTPEARDIQQRVEEHKREIDHVSRADHERVLMIFTRSDVHTATVGKRSGEQVVIEDISLNPRPIVFASTLAESQIRHEVREAEDNVFKKGFLVDVNVETRNGNPVAYSITNLHSVIDLPDD